MRKLLLILSLAAGLLGQAAVAAETPVFNAATKALTLPRVVIDATIYQNLAVQLDDISLIAIGDAVAPASNSDALPSYMPSYDVVSNYLNLPRVQIADTVYSKVVVKLNSIQLLSIGDTTSRNALLAALPNNGLANRCATVRPASTINPSTGRPYPDQQGTLYDEMSWIKQFVNDTYLWYKDVPNVPTDNYFVGGTVAKVNTSTNVSSNTTLTSNYQVVDAYFNSQRTMAVTDSKVPVDQFHYTYTTDVWNSLSLSAASYGFGAHFAVLAGSPPRSIKVMSTEPNTPASKANITRGASIITINGVDVAYGSNYQLLNEALGSPIAGKEYTFEVLDLGATATRTVTMIPTTITETLVPTATTLPAPNNNVGYLVFNGFLAPAERELVAAISKLKAANNGAGITDLVLDLRYNGGGYLGIASELSYMLAGQAQTSGKVFSQLVYNDKNPFVYTAKQATTDFSPITQGFSLTAGQALPQLGLSRVFVLTSRNTASASEETINALRGIGLNVIQIGKTTRGKPYGFSGRDNCGTTYFAIQFKGINDKGFGDYADGFTPGPVANATSTLAGCSVSDDLNHALGDTNEAMLSAALQYRNNGTCPIAGTNRTASSKPSNLGEPVLIQSPLREMMWLDKPAQ